MPRIKSQKSARGAAVDLINEDPHVDASLRSFWETLPLARRRALLAIPRSKLFARIREAQPCSRCFGLFYLRYEELRSNAATGDCPACREFYSGLVVRADDGAVTLDDAILRSQPFTTFARCQERERERDLQFITGKIGIARRI